MSTNIGRRRLGQVASEDPIKCWLSTEHGDERQDHGALSGTAEMTAASESGPSEEFSAIPSSGSVPHCCLAAHESAKFRRLARILLPRHSRRRPRRGYLLPQPQVVSVLLPYGDLPRRPGFHRSRPEWPASGSCPDRYSAFP